MSIILDVCDAVVAELNAAYFTQEFTAVRALRPVYSMTQLATLRVTVLPGGIERVRESRSLIIEKIDVQVGVQQRVATEAEAEPLIDLTEEIVAAMEGLELTDYPDATHYETSVQTICDRDTLDRFNTYTGVITLTYWVGIEKH